MALVQCLVARAKAYSATTVLPALVWAATKTEWPCSRCSTASFWKGSSSKGKLCARFGLNLCNEERVTLFQMQHGLLLEGIQPKGEVVCQVRPQPVRRSGHVSLETAGILNFVELD